jgi:hypothetical protein
MPLSLATLNKYKKGNVFLETGTSWGGGIRLALDAGFQKIVSLEIDAEIANKASDTFHTQVYYGQVEIIKGDSAELLGSIIELINEPITFWLDAHLEESQHGAFKDKHPCPLYDELTFIRRHAVKEHVIMIDDMKIVGTGHFWGGTVEREVITDMLMAISQAYKIEIVDGEYAPGHIDEKDILVAYL